MGADEAPSFSRGRHGGAAQAGRRLRRRLPRAGTPPSRPARCSPTRSARRTPAAWPPARPSSNPTSTPAPRPRDRQDLAAQARREAAQQTSRWSLLPLIARGTTLGFIVCTRNDAHRAFDAYDVEIGMDFAARAALFIDNARRYSRERATALTLQRSMLPTGLTAPSSIEIRHRYLPGNQLIEVGGDWYESIALPGGRVALIVGDVAGHGVRAAVTMGRLRTALQTIVNLELSPSEGLQQLDALMREHRRARPRLRDLRLRRLRRDRRHLRDRLRRPPAAAAAAAERRQRVPRRTARAAARRRRGHHRVPYLHDRRRQHPRPLHRRPRGEPRPGHRRRPRSACAACSARKRSDRPLEDLAKATLDGAYSDHDRDDIAVLIARLRRLPEGTSCR